MKKFLMFCGLIAAVVYTVTVMLGGWLRPDYSHISMAISELVANGAPNRVLLSPLFLIYNILVSLFGIGLFLKLKNQSQGRISGMTGSLALTAVGAAGILMELVFPQEPGGTTMTFVGTMHLVMAGVASLGTMIAILFLAFSFKYHPEFKGFVAYSMISVTVILVSGAMTAAAMANHSPLFGLIERITIFTFILWMFVGAQKLAQLERESDEPGNFEIAASMLKGN